MKTCPQCEKTYPDSERFCATDGSALVPPGATGGHGGGGGARPGTGAGPLEQPGEPREPVKCPNCGGNAEPGEAYCGFCGTPLTDAGYGPTRVSPEEFAPGEERMMTERMAHDDATLLPEAGEVGPRRGRALGRVAYVVAAVAAVGAGVWLARKYTANLPSAPIAIGPSPSAPASPAAGPIVALASSMPIVVTGGNVAADRNDRAASQVFAQNQRALRDSYNQVLAGDISVHSGMLVRLSVSPQGVVTAGAVAVSTTPNPDLDAKVIGAMMDWQFKASAGGPVEIDYPVIFARDSVEEAGIESALSTVVARLSRGEPPEYASSLPESSPAASPAVVPPVVAAASPVSAPSEAATLSALAAAPPPVPIPPPPAAMPPPPAAIPPPAPGLAPSTPAGAVRGAPKVERRRRERHSTKVASLHPPKSTLLERVQETLRANRKFARVNAYTNGSVVVLYGRVFDDNDKVLAERTAKGVDGVSAVQDNLATDVAQWALEQSQISAQLASTGLSRVSVKVIGDRVYLGGEVNSDADKQRAVAIAEDAAPVKLGTNLIRVAPGKVFGF